MVLYIEKIIDRDTYPKIRKMYREEHFEQIMVVIEEFSDV